jgi:translation initiation factor 2B subunit (eIF-2B alpha/beta/delta family)
MRVDRKPGRRPAGADRAAAAFDRIRSDRTHGAWALALEALDALESVLDEWQRSHREPLPTVLRRSARRLETSQPAMGPFLRWAGALRELARSAPAPGLLSRSHRFLRREQAQLKRELSRLQRVGRRRFPADARHVITLSRSQTVLSVLSSLPPARRPVQVSVLESLPGGEGRLFAGDLRTAGLSARVLSDRAGPSAVRTADLVLIGADAVFSDGSVVHKVGTNRLARAAARKGVPVVVVAGRSKFTGRPAPSRPLPAWFDRTPARFLSEFWTDEGVRPGGRARVGPAHRRPL